MLTGWIHQRHETGRSLSQAEIVVGLDPAKRSPVFPCERMNLLRLNSVYAEFIDNRFFGRGYPTLLGMIFIPIFVAMALLGAPDLIKDLGGHLRVENVVFFILPLGVFSLCAFVVWKWLVVKDIRTYTYYPIRFNRKNRMIYVFRHNGVEGVLTIPWEKAFFFIGQGEGGERHLYELRCHVLDENGLIIETFGIGHDDTSRGGILELWEMIRVYMEEGPQHLPRYLINLFPQKVTWKESRLLMLTKIGGANMVMSIVTAPFWTIGALMHYLVLKTCKAPVWPPEIEETCRADHDDPYQLLEARYDPDDPRYDEIWRAESARRARNREVVRAWEQTQRGMHRASR